MHLLLVLHVVGHFLIHYLGIDTQASPFYDFWSGVGPVLFAQLPLLWIAVTTFRHKNCHVHRCWRVGRFPVTNSAWVVCRKHHPDGAPSQDDITAAHKGAGNGQD